MNLFYSNFDNDDKLITINQIDSKHIIRSFRKKIGDIIKITNGKGSICEAEILEEGKNIKVEVKRILNYKREKLSIHIAISPLKNSSRFEWFVEKATELGIYQITPIIGGQRLKVMRIFQRMKQLNLRFQNFLKS